MEGEGLLKIHPDDNVIVALDDLAAGESSNGYLIKKDLPQKHKFAEQDLAVGDIVRMYGVPIGTTTSPVAVGEPITVKNVVNFTSKYQPWKEKPQWDAPDISAWSSRTFRGYQRADGSVGTRNIWLVFPLVFCENRNIEIIKKSMLSALGYAKQDDQVISIDNLIKAYESDGDLDQVDLSRTSAEDKQSRLFEHVDGLRFLTHQAGCGGTRQDAQVLCELLAGYISNPNVAGATVLSLGCQNAEDRLLLDALQKRGNKKPVFILEQQQSKSEQDFLGEAIKKTFKGLAEANQLARTEVPISKLIVGLECGGSDGFSGISANPSLGHAVDLLVGSGGSAILSEFPELSGVEQELINRCQTSEAAEKFVRLMQAYEKRAEEVGSGFKDNPSPGNIKDGLITDAMKSAGASKKGGTSPIEDVLDYAEPVIKDGLNLLCTPGNDVESTTGLAGSGANLIVFTTGLGTPTGNPVAPTIKMSSNTKLAERMSDIIDVNAGTVITGEDTISSKGEELLEYLIRVASGEETAAERLGQEDFIPWKRGVSL